MKNRIEKIVWRKVAVLAAVLVSLVIFTSALFPDASETELALEQINTQSDSTEISDIEADVAATKFTDFTDELAGLGEKLK